MVSDQGMGVALVAIGPVDQAEYYRTLITTVASTVRFVPPVPQTAAGSADSEWDRTVRGRKLHYLYSSDGYTNEEQIDLCSDGSFAKSGGGGGFGGGTPGASGAWQHGGSGRWTITNGELVLGYPSGEQESYTLSWDDDKLFLNGYRYFRTTLDRCS